MEFAVRAATFLATLVSGAVVVLRVPGERTMQNSVLMSSVGSVASEQPDLLLVLSGGVARLASALICRGGRGVCVSMAAPGAGGARLSVSGIRSLSMNIF
jgi:hypothetical protein